MSDQSEGLRKRFAGLHDRGTFVIPNAWDAGSLHILASLGFAAIATTSSGLAASLGRMDQEVTLDELERHVALLVSESPVPVSVDAEDGYAGTPQGVAITVERLAGTGAAGVSIEDYSPETGIYPLPVAVDRISLAGEAAHRQGMTLTGRAENHLYGVDDLEDTITRLVAYRDAGADVLYAPGLVDSTQIRSVVDEVGAPVNVLLLRSGPGVAELSDLGVRRISTGGGLAFAAYGALARAGRELLEFGTSSYLDEALSQEDRRRAFRRD